jgi:hypothetical protein
MRPPVATTALVPILLAAVLALGLAAADCRAGTSKGQTLYVPCYASIYHGIKTRPLDLTVTLSVRNTNPGQDITIASVDYHDSTGRLVRRYLDKPMVLGPLAAKEFIIKELDRSGGVGASFLVRWSADTAVNEPVVEAIMIGTSSNQGVSFTSPARAIQE